MFYSPSKCRLLNVPSTPFFQIRLTSDFLNKVLTFKFTFGRKFRSLCFFLGLIILRVLYRLNILRNSESSKPCINLNRSTPFLGIFCCSANPLFIFPLDIDLLAGFIFANRKDPEDPSNAPVTPSKIRSATSNGSPLAETTIV